MSTILYTGIISSSFLLFLISLLEKLVNEAITLSENPSFFASSNISLDKFVIFHPLKFDIIFSISTIFENERVNQGSIIVFFDKSSGLMPFLNAEKMAQSLSSFGVRSLFKFSEFQVSFSHR